MPPLLAAAAGPPWASAVIIAASAACYVFLVLLPLYFKDRGSAVQPDPRAANLRTAALLLLVVGVFLTAFTAGIRFAYSPGAASVLGVEAAAYFAAATAVLLAARRRSAKTPG
jgi:hypothetical protein